MINSLKLTIDSSSKNSDVDRIKRASPILFDLLTEGIPFSPATVIIGENGSGKSLLFILLIHALKIDYSESRKSPIISLLYQVSGLRGFGMGDIQNQLEVKFDKKTEVIYHSGLNPRSSEVTDRLFSSSGEGSLYELLSYTSDIAKYNPSRNKSVTSGTDLVSHFTSITKQFSKGDLDLYIRNNCTLLTDEPEASLSRGRVQSLMDHLSQWIVQGNQLIMATNHPWLIEKWAPDHKAQIIDLDTGSVT